jgi:hypothetical protein
MAYDMAGSHATRPRCRALQGVTSRFYLTEADMEFCGIDLHSNNSVVVISGFCRDKEGGSNKC